MDAEQRTQLVQVEKVLSGAAAMLELHARPYLVALQEALVDRRDHEIAGMSLEDGSLLNAEINSLIDGISQLDRAAELMDGARGEVKGARCMEHATLDKTNRKD